MGLSPLDETSEFVTCADVQQETCNIEGQNVRLDPIKAMPNGFCNKLRHARRDWPSLVDTDRETLAIYDRVKNSGTYNALALREELPSILRYDNWERAKTGHPDDDWVVDLVRFGFPLQFHEEFDSIHGKEFPNHASGANYPEHIGAYIRTEIDNETLLGPFRKKPFSRMNVAPIMTRPKADGYKRRVIVDYTYPEGSGINAMIRKNELFGVPLSHSLPTVAQALHVIRQKQFQVKLATIDLERAYRNFKTDPYDWPLTTIAFEGQYYVDTGLPFGSRTSSLYVQRIAEFIMRALHTKGIYMSMYLDDGLIISDHGQDHDAVLMEVIDVIRSLGLPLAWDKIQSPSNICTFLGIEIDLVTRRTKIPMKKLVAFRETLREVKGKSMITRAQLQSIIGSVNHVAKCVWGARLFMNRLLSCLRECSERFVHVDAEILADLEWFDKFMIRYNGCNIIPGTHVFAHIYVDSCLVGAAGLCDNRCYMYKYSHRISSSFHITQLEALNCLMAVRAFTGNVTGKTIQIHCDNLATVMTFSNSRGRDHVLNAIARALWYHAASRDLDLRFVHISGEDIPIVDALSRAYISEDNMISARRIISDKGFNNIIIPASYHDFNQYL